MEITGAEEKNSLPHSSNANRSGEFIEAGVRSRRQDFAAGLPHHCRNGFSGDKSKPVTA
jgi:hypothetical protein